MIIRETEHEFIMIAQHDHANFSGVAAQHFSEEIIKKCDLSGQYLQDFILAVFEHDRSWIRLDETPIWNDQIRAPFSFMDYPHLPKLTLYQYGLDEIERMSKYASLLCSMHYSSFFKDSSQKDDAVFYRYEIARQTRIKEELTIKDQEFINRHFRLLQFCDDVSLYVGLNEPGVSKEKEHPWYRNGFSKTVFLSSNNSVLTAKWKSQDEIVISHFPFEDEFSTTLRQKRVPKELISRIGVGAAYKQTEFFDQCIIICK